MDKPYSFHNMVGGQYYSKALGHIYKAPSLKSRFQRIQNGRVKFGSTRGMGVGNILSKIFQFSKPILKVLGQKVFNVASNAISDGIQGKNLIDSVKTHAAAEASNTLNAAPVVVKKIINKVISKIPQKRSLSPTTEQSGQTNSTKRKKRNKRTHIRSFKAFPALSLLKK